MSVSSAQPSAAASGFTLIQLSIILTIASLLMVSMLPGQEAGDVNRKGVDDVAKLAKIEDAMKGFMALNGRRPCPADGQYTVDTHNFGIEAANPGTCTGGTPTATLGPDASTGYIVAGVIPTKSLNIPDELAFDSFGRRFTYAVDARATNLKSCRLLQGSNNLGTGAIQINDATGTPTDHTMVAYIGHGPDGHGAWPIQSNGNGGPMANGTADNQRLNAGSTDVDTLNNANVDSSFNVSFDNVFVKKDRTAKFDDLVYYEQPTKNNCCIGLMCTPIGFRGINTENNITSMAVGDVNGDGIPDLIVGVNGAWGNCPGGWSCGWIYVLFGSGNGFNDPTDLSQLNGSNGFIVEQDELGPGAWAGSNVAAADINGDGITDIIFTESGTGQAPDTGYGSPISVRGSTYVLFGQKCGGMWPTPCPAVVHNAGFDDGIHGMRYDNTVVQHSNVAVWYNDMSLATGDINGDGVQDLIIGDMGSGWYQPPPWYGQAHVIFGQKCGGLWPTPCSTPVLLSAGTNPLDGTHGFEIIGAVAGDQFPTSMAMGNVSGHLDSTRDLVISADAYYGMGGNPTPGIYVIYGKTHGTWPATVSLSSSLDGVTASQFYNSQSSGQMDGMSVAVGDVNSDGIDDIAFVSANVWVWDSASEFTTGVVHVIYGRTGDYPPTSDLWSYENGVQGYTIYQPAYAGFGGLTQSQLAIGDVNNDGINDIVFGSKSSTMSRNNNGVDWVLYGKPGTSMPSGAWLGGNPQGTNPLLDGIQGFQLDGPASNCSAGWYNVIGDINNDGISDILEGDTCGVDVVFGMKPGKWQYLTYDMNNL